MKITDGEKRLLETVRWDGKAKEKGGTGLRECEKGLVLFMIGKLKEEKRK